MQPAVEQVVNPARHAAGLAWDRLFSDREGASALHGRYFYERALPHVDRGDRVCDVGCGDAFYVDELMSRCGAQGYFLALDRSAVALGLCAAQCSRFAHVGIVQADLLGLPLPDRSMDCVLCAETLPYLLDDAERGLAELARVATREVIFSLHARGAYEIAGSTLQIRGRVVTEHGLRAKPPRVFCNPADIPAMVGRSMPGFVIEAVDPLPWSELMTGLPSDDDWPWFLPPPDTVALYFVVARSATPAGATAGHRCTA